METKSTLHCEMCDGKIGCGGKQEDCQCHRSNLHDEIERIEKTMSDLLAQYSGAATEENYKAFMTALRSSLQDIAQKTVAAERQRILTLLSSFSDSPVIQQVIELIYKK